MQTALEVSTVRSWKFSDLVRADIVKKSSCCYRPKILTHSSYKQEVPVMTGERTVMRAALCEFSLKHYVPSDHHIRSIGRFDCPIYRST
jgi:hypothetical protein